MKKKDTQVIAKSAVDVRSTKPHLANAQGKGVIERFFMSMRNSTLAKKAEVQHVAKALVLK